MEVVVPALFVTGLRSDVKLFVSPDGLSVAHIEAEEVQLHSRKYIGCSCRIEFDGSLWRASGRMLHSRTRTRPTDAAYATWEALAVRVCTELQRSDEWARISLQNEMTGAKMVSNYARRELETMKQDMSKVQKMIDNSDALLSLARETLTAEEHSVAAALINAGHSVADAILAAKAIKSC
jgi:hypothetical protein